jgi:hypothetical protein
MDPPPPLSPNKMPFSPGMPIFPASPERAGSVKQPFGTSGSPVMSPSTPNLRASSPLRPNSHRRGDSDVSVQALAGMFENLEVKDPREACKRFKELLEKEKIRNAEKLNKLEKEHAKKERDHEMALSRRDVRIDELKSQVEQANGSLQVGITKDRYEKEHKAHKAAIDKWETVFKQNEERWRQQQAKVVSHEITINGHPPANVIPERSGKSLPNVRGQIQELQEAMGGSQQRQAEALVHDPTTTDQDPGPPA